MNNAGRNLIIFVAIVVISIGAVVFFVQQISHSTLLTGPPTPSPIARAAINEVRLTVQGPIVANEQFVSETLDISAAQRNLTANVTYPGELVTSQTLGNNNPAYDQFLGALLDADYTMASRGRNVTATAASACPLGLRFTYDALDSSGHTLSSLWASTCGTNAQSFNGNMQLVNQLFRAQFPNIVNLNQQFPVLQPLQW